MANAFKLSHFMKEFYLMNEDFMTHLHKPCHLLHNQDCTRSRKSRQEVYTFHWGNSHAIQSSTYLLLWQRHSLAALLL